MPKAEPKAILTVGELKKLINKRWGEGTMKYGSDPELLIKRIPSGILSIDTILGGGFSRGRHTEIFGSYSVGKTYVAQRLIANAQSLGLTCAYVDVENSFDPEFAKHIGIDIDDLAYHRQEHGNRVIDFIEVLLRTGLLDVIVLDSIAALLPKSELEEDMEKGSYGTAQAKMMSAAMRRLTTANSKTVLVYINQTRDSLGSVFQKRAVTSGGRAMGFYAGTRLEMVKTENIKRKGKIVNTSTGEISQGDQVKGHRVLVRVEKDKTGGSRPQSTTTFVYDYDLSAIDHLEDLMYLGRVKGLIKKSGNNWWLSDYPEEKKNGRTRFKKWLKQRPSIQQELEEQILETDDNEEVDDGDEE